MSERSPAVAFQSKRLIVRNWREEDREPFAAMNADPRVMEFFPTTLTREQSDAALELIMQHLDTHGYGMWVIERRSTGGFAGVGGYTNLGGEDPSRPLVELSCRMLPKFWVGGLAAEAGIACLKYGFTVLKLPEVIGYACKRHAVSQRLMERIGMIHQEHADFLHPSFPEGHPSQPHVLYRIRADQFAANGNIS